MNSPLFLSAVPVWPDGRGGEMNAFAGFRVAFTPAGDRPIVLRLTAATVYRAFLNGEFLGYGPARAPLEYARVDIYDLTSLLIPGRNLLAIEVSAYNINTYYHLEQPAFLQAELVEEGKCIASTGGAGKHFQGRMLAERTQPVERYSVARGFSEIYRLHPAFAAWRADPDASFAPDPLALMPVRRLLPRGAGYPEYRLFSPRGIVARGRQVMGLSREVKKEWTLTMIGPELRGFREEQIPFLPSQLLQQSESRDLRTVREPFPADGILALSAGEFGILDFDRNIAGFIRWTVRTERALRLYCTFDEVLTGGDVDYLRLRCVNCIVLDLEPGEVRFESMEPYALRYLKFFAPGGDVRISRIALREYAGAGGTRARFMCSDRRFVALFEAGRETFRQNAVDVFTDCPSRERAGWLCDSFFLARTAHRLYGTADLERTYLENYLLPPSFPHLPAGMVPMCYPADHDNGNFIPNWALWLIFQLEEYEQRSSDRSLVDAFRPRVMAILDYFARFRNSDGLLENLEGWVFVEWSRANDFVQNVNYPTNMAYAAALSSAAKLYGLPALQDDAERIRLIIREQAFDGEFFVDNAVRTDGVLHRTDNATEVCQYHAFAFGVATPESHPRTWEQLVSEAGPNLPGGQLKGRLHAANALLGLPLRFELLSKYGRQQRLLEEVAALYGPMVESTGTLWEHVEATASCSHGFASHVVSLLFKDLLGVAAVEESERTVHLRFADTDVESCAGSFPVGEGDVTVRWRVEGAIRRVAVSTPPGYSVHIEDVSGRTVEREEP